jgi:peptidoglycan/xylan/chitin deacetylase (PgdA/CDA1 family)
VQEPALTLRRQIACGISQAVSGIRCFADARRGLRVLMYHAIGSPALGDRLGIFSLAPRLFEAQIDFLSGFHREQVCALEAGVALSERSLQIAITFDDGYLDNLKVAAPILADKQLPFTVFVTSGHVRHGRKGFLNAASLRELASVPGAIIGAHGTSHIPLVDCDDDQLENELRSSRKYLEDIIGREVITMSYPHGSVNRRVRQAAADAGYRLATCSYADINRPGRDLLLLGRTEVLSGDTLSIYRQKLKGNWDWYRWRTTDPARL